MTFSWRILKSVDVVDVDSGLNGGPSFLDTDCSVGGVAPPEDGAVLRQKIKGGNNLLWAVTTDNCGH